MAVNGYDRITERIIALLQQGTVPWHRPWTAKTGWPRNYVTQKPYRGINVFLLTAMCYESPFWLTFLQASQLGGTIRKGEKACPVVFWKRLQVDDEESGEPKKIPLLRIYYVFNTAQCDGLKDAVPVKDEIVTVKPAEIVAGKPNHHANTNLALWWVRRKSCISSTEAISSSSIKRNRSFSSEVRLKRSRR